MERTHVEKHRHVIIQASHGLACAMLPDKTHVVTAQDYHAPTVKEHADNSKLALQPNMGNFDPTVNNNGIVGICTMSIDMYSKVLKVVARPHGNTVSARQCIALITYRKDDGHKDLWVYGKDHKLHRYAGKFPQNKRNSIPKLCELLNIGREWDVTII